MLSLEDARNYFSIDNEDDDVLVEALLNKAKKICVDISRCMMRNFQNML
jgi:hypothetical protein